MVVVEGFTRSGGLRRQREPACGDIDACQARVLEASRDEVFAKPAAREERE